MTKPVRLARSALDEMNKVYEWIWIDSPSAAENWLEQVEAKIHSLADFPRRNPRAPEARTFRGDIRHLVVGNYRVIYEVTAEQVVVLHVRHAARRPLPKRR